MGYGIRYAGHESQHTESRYMAAEGYRDHHHSIEEGGWGVGVGGTTQIISTHNIINNVETHINDVHHHD